ncbi:MAG TPA: tetratricopeptide repeat protein [Phycisphaerales bacterium]
MHAIAAVVVIVLLAAGFVYVLRAPGEPLVKRAPDEKKTVEATSVAPAAALPVATGPSASKVDAILESVETLSRAGKGAEVEAVLKGAIAQYPADQRLYIAYAEALLGRDALAPAYESYEKALATGERTAALEFQAGTVASMLGKRDRAEEHYAAAQKANPNHAEYPLFLGQVQMQLNKLDEARASLVRAAQLNPNEARAWGSLAELAVRENKIEVALQQIAKARELEPRATVWRFIEARAQLRAGKAKEAAELLLPLDPKEKTSESIARLLADALSAQKRDAEAAAVLAAASDADEKNAALAFDAAVRAKKAGDAGLLRRLRDRAGALGHAGAQDLGNVELP